MTELFLSKPDEARTYGANSSERFERAQLGGLTSLEFGSLWAIFEEEPWDQKRHDLPMVTSADDTWIFRFPDKCIARFERVQPAEITKAASKWAEMEELEGTAPAELEPAIEALVKLARSAKSSGRGLYLWNAL
jgi:hypothetical protein